MTFERALRLGIRLKAWNTTPDRVAAILGQGGATEPRNLLPVQADRARRWA